MKKNRNIINGIALYYLNVLLFVILFNLIGSSVVSVYFIFLFLFINPLLIIVFDFWFDKTIIFKSYYLALLVITLLFEFFVKFKLLPIQNSILSNKYLLVMLFVFFLQLFIAKYLIKEKKVNSVCIPTLLALPILIFTIFFAPAMLLSFALLNMVP